MTADLDGAPVPGVEGFDRVGQSSLVERTELCLTVGGTRRGKLTLYAGPDEREGVAVAILTGVDGQTYVSSAGNTGIEKWIASILRSAETLTDALHSVTIAGQNG